MDLSIVVVNWNTRDLLENCLRSVFQTIQGLTFEIIVVDNASHDGSTSMLEKKYPGILTIRNTENRGFAVANNQALKIVKGRYALLLNTDAVLTDNAASALVAFMETHPEAAMAVGQLLNADGSKQNSVAPFPTPFTLLVNMPILEYLNPARYPSKRHDYKEPVEIDSGIGACILVRKKAMEDVGLLDERYFFFFEETDWARQMRSKGWKVFYVPAARIYHLQGQSVGRDVRSRILFYRSRDQYFQKWNDPPIYAFTVLFVFLRLTVNWLLTTVANIILLGMNKGLRNKWIVYSKLILWYVRGRP